MEHYYHSQTGLMKHNYRWNPELESHEHCFYSGATIHNGALAIARAANGVAIRLLAPVEPQGGQQQAITMHFPAECIPDVAAALLEFDDHPPVIL